MALLTGENIILRSVDSSDIDTILLWENTSSDPLYGIAEERYSREDVARFVALQQQYPIEQTEQVRLMICSPDGERLGAIDLSDYDGTKAALSIIIFEPHNRHLGLGSEALRLMTEYAESLGLRQLEATIHPENAASLALFKGALFESVGDGRFIRQLPIEK